MGEGLSHWSSMVLRKSQTCFSDRHTHPNSMYSNFCHVLKIFLLALIIYLGLYIKTILMAKRRNRSPILWFLFCFVVSPILTVILLYILGPSRDNSYWNKR